MLLEVIVNTVEDAMAAERGGAHRLEIVRELERGGLTPAYETVAAICAAVSIPVRVMVRDEEPFFLGEDATSIKKMERMADYVRSIAELRVEGIVLGMLQRNERAEIVIHQGFLTRILGAAPQLQATFHRAFELLPDFDRGVQELKRHRQIDRILTSIGAPSDAKSDWSERMKGLAELTRHAAPNLTILVGGGVTATAIELLWQNVAIKEIHVGTLVRVPPSVAGAVQPAAVRALAARLSQPRPVV